MEIRDLSVIKNTVIKEITDASLNNPSSFSYLSHPLAFEPLITAEVKFQVLVIGGSICKKALAQKEGQKITILSQEEKPQPNFQSAEDLFTFIQKELDPDVDTLALNFAYPLQPVFREGKLDGTLRSGTKENTFTNLVGKQVGLEIEQHLKDQRILHVSVANDTICLLLSGLAQFPWNNLAGGIVGTGLNFAYFTEKNTIVNLEAANFDKFPLSEAAKLIDAESANPGKALFEKETAGAYLYKHFNILSQQKNLSGSPLSSTEELNELAEHDQTEKGTLALNILSRSAALVACQIAGIADFKKSDMTFVMEGSLFWQGFQYKKTVEEQITLLTPHHVQFILIEQSSLLGAAQLISS